MPLSSIFRRKSWKSRGITSDESLVEPGYTTRLAEANLKRLSPSIYAYPSHGTSPATRRPHEDLPPAYTPAIATEDDDAYAFLSNFDTVFLIDDSGSMAGRSWRETALALSVITPRCTRHDADGIDLYFLNAADQPQHKNLRCAADITRIFNAVRPGGGTPTGRKLRSIIEPHLVQLESASTPAPVKPLNIIVITDGQASDDVESIITDAARRLDALRACPWQIGIQFFQVGSEPEAAAALQELDDGLVGFRDIVDTVAWNGAHGSGLNAEGILKVVLGAVHRKYDRRALTAA